MVSIVIPVYNGQEFVEKAIESVKRQTYTDWELIILDDCSTDNTYEVIKSYENPKIRILRNETNKGVGITRQRALSAAEGEFVMFVDADDYLPDDALEVSIKMQEQYDSDFVYSAMDIEYPDRNEKLTNGGEGLATDEGRLNIYFANSLKFITGKLIRKKLFELVDFPTYRVGEDIQLLVQLLYYSNNVRISDISTYVHVFREGSLLGNANYSLCQLANLRSEIEIFNFVRTTEFDRLAKYMAKRVLMLYDNVKKQIKTGKMPPNDVRKYKELWVYCQNRFNGVKNIVKQYEI